jgi:expansin (peptidoglycan-binding protein)
MAGGLLMLVSNGAQDVYLTNNLPEGSSSEHELLAKNTFVEISRLLRGVLKRVIKHATLGHNTDIDTASRVTRFLNAENQVAKS